MKRSYVFIVAVILILGGGVYLAVNQLSSVQFENKSPASPAPVCPAQQGATVVIAIRGDQMRPAHAYGKRCDLLTIVNYDDKQRLIAFGSHEHHQPYNGITETILNKDQEFSVTLNAVGTYLVHDHYEDTVHAEFTVTD